MTSFLLLNCRLQKNGDNPKGENLNFHTDLHHGGHTSNKEDMESTILKKFDTNTVIFAPIPTRIPNQPLMDVVL